MDSDWGRMWDFGLLAYSLSVLLLAPTGGGGPSQQVSFRSVYTLQLVRFCVALTVT